MPEFQPRRYKINGFTAVIRYHHGTYEARVRQKGVSATLCAKSVQLVKERVRAFTAQLKPSQRASRQKDSPPPVTAEYCVSEWLKKKASVQKPNTFKMTRYAFSKHCLDLALSRASSVQIQSALSSMTPRTALYAYTLLSDYWETASELSGLPSPMKNVVRPLYEPSVRPRATLAQIAGILSSEHKLASGAKLSLCTGMRRGEIKTARIEGEFVVCLTEKTRRGAREKWRKIPVTDSRVAEWLEQARGISGDALSRSMAEICPGLHFHDLRHTFASLCKEAGVNPEAVSLWLGHALGGTTGRVYTHYTDAFMLAEAEKLRRVFPPEFPPKS